MKKLLLALSLAGFSSIPAHAGIPIVWGDNEKILKIADFPNVDEFKTQQGDQLHPGWCWKQFQLFWVPLWNHNGHYCGYINDNTYASLSREDLVDIASTLKVPTDWANAEPKLPFWDSIGGKLVAALTVLILLGGALLKRKN